MTTVQKEKSYKKNCSSLSLLLDKFVEIMATTRAKNAFLDGNFVAKNHLLLNSFKPVKLNTFFHFIIYNFIGFALALILANIQEA